LLDPHFSCYHEHMNMRNRDNMKPRKRAPETGTLVGVRLQEPTLKAVDGWRLSEPDLPSRPEAIRRLIEIAVASGVRIS
jgi:hypothetical protein